MMKKLLLLIIVLLLLSSIVSAQEHEFELTEFTIEGKDFIGDIFSSMTNLISSVIPGAIFSGVFEPGGGVQMEFIFTPICRFGEYQADSYNIKITDPRGIVVLNRNISDNDPLECDGAFTQSRLTSIFYIPSTAIEGAYTVIATTRNTATTFVIAQDIGYFNILSISPGTAFVTINSDPDSAIIFIDGQNFGVSPVQVDLQVNEKYRIRCTKSGFNFGELNLQYLSSGNKSETCFLEASPDTLSTTPLLPDEGPVLVSPITGPLTADPNAGVLKIRSVPSGVGAFIDLKPIGVTDTSGVLTFFVAEGPHQLILKKAGYATDAQNIVIVANKSLIVEVNLHKLVDTTLSTSSITDDPTGASAVDTINCPEREEIFIDSFCSGDGLKTTDIGIIIYSGDDCQANRDIESREEPDSSCSGAIKPNCSKFVDTQTCVGSQVLFKRTCEVQDTDGTFRERIDEETQQLAGRCTGELNDEIDPFIIGFGFILLIAGAIFGGNYILQQSKQTKRRGKRK